MIIIIWYCA